MRIDYYHKIATSEAQRSFFNAQLAAAGGFLIVIAAAITAAAANSATASIAAGATGAVGGALGGYVGRTFIQMQQEAESNLRAFFQQPVQVSQTLLAERMAKMRGEKVSDDMPAKAVDGTAKSSDGTSGQLAAAAKDRENGDTEGAE